MRKVFVLAGLLLATTWPLLACEICGCALTGQFPGVLPRFHSSALTTRYDVDHFLTDHYGRLQEETFQQYSLQARWEFSPRWQLTGVLPYRLNTQVAKTESLRINGLGDLQLNAWYTLWNNADSLNKNVKQTLQVGVGVSVPSGRFRLSEDGLIHPNLQTGSGAWNLPLSLAYGIRVKDWGLQTNAQYLINTVNSQGFRYGNQAAARVGLFYWFQYQFLSIIPQIGLQYNHSRAHRQNAAVLDLSGGYTLLGTTGLDFYHLRWGGSIQYKKPVKQRLNQGFSQFQDGWTVSASRLF